MRVEKILRPSILDVQQRIHMVMMAESKCHPVVYEDPQNNWIGVDGKMMRLADPWEHFPSTDQPSRMQ